MGACEPRDVRCGCREIRPVSECRGQRVAPHLRLPGATLAEVRVKLDEKRKVIEVLLCAGGDANDVSMNAARHIVGVAYGSVWPAVEDSYADTRSSWRFTFSDRLTEVAYRLIESSPTLRREWFGAR